MTTTRRRPVPIYTSAGDVEAYMVYPMLYNLGGDWVGFVTPNRDVYSVLGHYVGWLSDDPRILRKKSYDYDKPKLKPPNKPGKFTAPASAPLAPLMPDLSFDTLDILMDEPDRLHGLDSGDFKPDLD
ncbi:4-fold beta flower protein [Chloroflexota bacterium]